MSTLTDIMPYLAACVENFDKLNTFQQGLIGGVVNMVSRNRGYAITDKQVSIIMASYTQVVLVPMIPEKVMAKIREDAKEHAAAKGGKNDDDDGKPF